MPTLAATLAQDSFVVSVLAGEHTPDLAALSEIGLQALNYIDQKQAAPEQWRVQSLQRVSEASKPKADVLIMIAPAVQRSAVTPAPVLRTRISPTLSGRSWRSGWTRPPRLAAAPPGLLA